jgi:hypothetical protein
VWLDLRFGGKVDEARWTERYLGERKVDRPLRDLGAEFPLIR